MPLFHKPQGDRPNWDSTLPRRIQWNTPPDQIARNARCHHIKKGWYSMSIRSEISSKNWRKTFNKRLSTRGKLYFSIMGDPPSLPPCPLSHFLTSAKLKMITFWSLHVASPNFEEQHVKWEIYQWRQPETRFPEEGWLSAKQAFGLDCYLRFMTFAFTRKAHLDALEGFQNYRQS